jgi:hypothetical protein
MPNAGAVIAQSDEGDPAFIALAKKVNDRLARRGLNIALEQVEFYTIGGGRPSNRIHALPFRWVANDPHRPRGRRPVDLCRRPERWDHGERLDQHTDRSGDRSRVRHLAATAVSHEGRSRQAARFGRGSRYLRFFFGFGGFGNPFVADIVDAGWLPRAFFESTGGPGAGRGTLAFTVTFIFVDEVTGFPTDINGDRRLDTARSEVYYNDTFGDPTNDRAGNPWGIDVPLPGIDVETAALHENGHGLGIGHFGPPPTALMNPAYGGIRHAPFSIDNAGICAQYASWPK